MWEMASKSYTATSVKFSTAEYGHERIQCGYSFQLLNQLILKTTISQWNKFKADYNTWLFQHAGTRWCIKCLLIISPTHRCQQLLHTPRKSCIKAKTNLKLFSTNIIS